MRLIAILFFALAFQSCARPEQGFSLRNDTEMYRYVSPSIVKVEIPDRGTGSGFYVNDMLGRKVIISNAHVCEKPGQRLIIRPSRVGKAFAVYPRHISFAQDLCIIMAPKGDFHPALPLAPRALADGEAVFAAGHPHGQPLTVTSGTVVGDTISEIGYPAEFCRYGGTLVPTFLGQVCAKKMPGFIITAVTAPGSSGGAALNAQGEVVGVTFAGGEGTALALRLENLVKVLSLLK